jgi:predicted DNA-binding transcriptional regulator AlpA
MIDSFIQDAIKQQIKESIPEIAAAISEALSHTKQDDDIPRDIEWLCNYTGLKRQTIYQNIDNIPHRKINGKSLRFFKSEIDKNMLNK